MSFRGTFSPREKNFHHHRITEEEEEEEKEEHKEHTMTSSSVSSLRLLHSHKHVEFIKNSSLDTETIESVSYTHLTLPTKA